MLDRGQQGENAVRTEGGPAASERALMRAVLEDAIRCLIGEVGPRHQRGALAAEARQWIETADPRWPFSFENVCDGLGLDAANLRRRLLRDAPPPSLPDAPAPTLADARPPGGRRGTCTGGGWPRGGGGRWRTGGSLGVAASGRAARRRRSVTSCR